MTSDQQSVHKDDAVEALLEKAAPRPAPPLHIEEKIRAAVHTEWAAVSQRHRRWRTGRNLAVAATVLLAAVFSLNSLRQADVPTIEVARLDQSHGAVHFQSEDVDATSSEDISTIQAGQVLQTGSESAAGLKWLSGGSLRVDAKSRIEFVAADEIYLHSGRVYFDSAGSSSGSALVIRSQYGVATHVGTQYMTAVKDNRLVVSVREGEVIVENAQHKQTINPGQRAEMTTASRPTITNTTGIGADWAWIETVAPNISVDGRSAHEFLQWVSRETGFSVEFSSESAEHLARDTLLKGTVNADPRNELRMRMLTMDLDAKFDTEGAVITISDRD